MRTLACTGSVVTQPIQLNQEEIYHVRDTFRHEQVTRIETTNHSLYMYTHTHLSILEAIFHFERFNGDQVVWWEKRLAKL